MSRTLLLVLLLVAGCDDPAWLGADPDDPPAPVVSRFDPARAGTVTGRVTWPGPLPDAPEFLFGVPKADGSVEMRMMPNPNRPAIDPSTRAVAGAVVFLRGVDPAVAKPWDHPPARVEWRDRQVVVQQGNTTGRAGFVRRGDTVTFLSAEPVYHVLRGRGADFFSLTLPEPDRPSARTFSRPGRVELSSGAGYYWARADLFVCDHPYSTVTDRDGRFRLDGVPAGPAEVVAWLPGWLPAGRDRDPESGLITRMPYSDPVEASRPVTVVVGRTAAVDLSLP